MTTLYEANNHLLIHTDTIQPAQHRHMAAHIIVSLDECLTVQADGMEYLCHGIMLPSDVSHTVDSQNHRMLVFLYDSTTDVSKQIQKITCIPEASCRKIARLYDDLEMSYAPQNYGLFEKAALAELGITGSASQTNDERILSAMGYIRSMSSEKVTCQAVADAVHLSQSRFSHLFREQVGMTFAAYLIYQRIMVVYTRMLLGKSITEAALAAGFSSSAHFADVNRRVFGIPASAIVHDMTFIKVQ